MESLKEVLMQRDGLTSEQADERIKEASEDLQNRLEDEDEELPFDFMGEEFGLEPDYLMELL
jgi:hypothetical protein